MVAAIDFGTTFSGYAYSFKTDYEKDPCNILMCQSWASGTGSLISLKAPTCVLLDKNDEFYKFGYDAEEVYMQLAQENNHDEYTLFRRFKMGLHREEKITLDLEILDESGKKPMKALYIFSCVIRYLKDCLLKQLADRGTLVKNEDIHWVLTVPAIWSDGSKQFMRTAAKQADINDSQLTIALEPEVASLYCQLIPRDQLKGSFGSSFSIFSPGTKYLIIDLGGGTADITVHMRQVDGTLEELHKASGGAWGGMKVDEEFTQLLIKLVGAPVFKKFCEENKEDHLDFQRELEVKKRTIRPDTEGRVTLKIPISLNEIFEQENQMGETLQDAIDQSLYKGKIDWKKDKMRINADVFKAMFKVCSDKLVSHIKNLLSDSKVRGTNIFLMVGGFSESEMMQNAVKNAFPSSRVIVPAESGLVVLKGAVVFGHRPSTITSRISKYTYGINISPPFDAQKHDEKYRVTVGGMIRCRGVFKKYILADDCVKVGEARSGKHVTLKKNQKEMVLKIYSSEKKDIMYVDDKGVKCLGKLIVDLPDVEELIRVEVRMMFGDTELMVEAEELTQHNKFRAYFDFL